MKRSDKDGLRAAAPPRRRRRKQRGAIAVEFALVLPLFLCALGLVLNTGLSFYARFQLTNYAQASARYCVSQVNVKQNQLSSCVSSYMNSLDLTHIEGLCRNIEVTPSVMPGPNTNPDMGILQVQVTCAALWSTLANTVRAAPDTLTITIKSSMPFQAVNF